MRKCVNMLFNSQSVTAAKKWNVVKFNVEINMFFGREGENQAHEIQISV